MTIDDDDDDNDHDDDDDYDDKSNDDNGSSDADNTVWQSSDNDSKARRHGLFTYDFFQQTESFSNKKNHNRHEKTLKT